MKKLLVMGSNFGCIELLREAKSRGYYTIVTDYYDAEHSNAKKECDECWDLSTSDTEALAKKCKEEHVDAVTCGVSEFNSEMTFKLCDAAGLPKYCSWEAWEYPRNKRKFKDLCKAHGVRVAADYDISVLDRGGTIDESLLPVVVKPIDSCANVGVSFCYSQEELRPAYEYAKSVTKQPDTIICEQMLAGREYAAAYAMLDGEARLINLFAMHSEEGTPSNMYTLDVTTTGVLDRYLEEIEPGITKAFKAAGFDGGVLWIELMQDVKDQHLYVLECGYRFPASMIFYTFKEVAGFDAVSWYLDSFMGIKHTEADLPAPQRREFEKYGVTYLLWNGPGGKIKEINGLDKVLADERVDIVDCLRKPGYELTPNTLMGEVIFTADTKEEAIAIIEFVNENVRFITEDGTDVLVRYTSFDKIY